MIPAKGRQADELKAIRSRLTFLGGCDLEWNGLTALRRLLHVRADGDGCERGASPKCRRQVASDDPSAAIIRRHRTHRVEIAFHGGRCCKPPSENLFSGWAVHLYVGTLTRPDDSLLDDTLPTGYT